MRNVIDRFLLVLFLALLVLLFVGDASATCSSPISRTNNAANSVLTSSKYNTDINTVYNHANDLDGDCITAGTIPDTALDTTNLGPQFNAIHQGFKCSRSDASTIGISKGWITVNGNNITTSSSTSIQFGCTGCSAEATATAYYVALKTGTVEDPVITTTAPDDNGYQGTSKYLCKFYNDGDGDIASGSIGQWVVNAFSPVTSHIRVVGYNGYGSTNTKIVRYDDLHSITSDDFTFTQSAGNGDSITINTSGYYQVTHNVDASASNAYGTSVNSSELTTNIQSILRENIVTYHSNTGGSGTNMAAVHYFHAGDVIRGHHAGSAATDQTFLEITRLH